MENLEYRPIREDETAKIIDLFKRNNMPFDVEFIIRLLNLSIPPKSIILGSFHKDELVGLYSLYAYKLYFAGNIEDAAIASFITTDKAVRGKGLGTGLIEELAGYAKTVGLDFISAFIDTKLGGWKDVINKGWERFGYHYKQLSILTPFFRPYGSKLPEISTNELSSFQVNKLSFEHIEEAQSFAQSFYNRYYIAELPDQNTARQLELYPEKYHWFSIDYGGRKVGYISCFHYLVHKGNKIQEQIHFNHLVVDEVYLPGAVNAVISKLESLDFKPDIYVINNSSLISTIFLYRAAFHPGFSRIQQVLRCRSKKKFVMDIFQKIDGTLPFSLTIL